MKEGETMQEITTVGLDLAKKRVPLDRLQRARQRGQAQDAQAWTGDGVFCQPAAVPDRYGACASAHYLVE
jgi:hypothetical protein